MDPKTAQILLGAAGSGGAAAAELYVDDVFSTYLITGTGSAQTINVGIDFSGEGGLLWFKNRDTSDAHIIVDTERGGPAKTIRPNADSAEVSYGTNIFGGFTSTGYVTGDSGMTGGTGEDAVYWGFRKAPGFCDVVTYTGDGTTSRAISHSLGSTPGFIAIKARSTTGNWICWHRDLTTNYSILLNSTSGEQGYTRISNIGASSFSVNDYSSFIGSTNASGVSYVAYVFAHDDQSFGTDGNESIIKCGSYTGASAPNAVNVGFEPQFVIVKRTDDTNNWVIHDAMRGAPEELNANNTNPEVTENGFKLTSTGFELTDASGQFNTNGGSYIYIAIRRPHKPPSAGTDVFASQTTTPEQNSWTPGFAPDALFTTLLESADNVIGARLTGHGRTLKTNSSAAELNSNNQILWDQPTGTIKQQYFQSSVSEGRTGLHYAFKRAPGFFDVVAYTGTSSIRTVNHNLGVVPELMLFKDRDGSFGWVVYHAAGGNTKYLTLNDINAEGTSSAVFNSTTPTASVITLGDFGSTNQSARNFIAYLFATLDDISKVGSYSGTGSNIDVDCGFTAGARFVLIKRTDSTGDWYVWDSTRGIVSGNDPYLLLNSSAAQVTSTDYIDPLNAGFTVTSSAPAALNTSGGTYLFFAIA